MESENLTQEKLDQVLKAVTKDHRKKWIETVSTILLSAATLLSSWCVFQSSQWSGQKSSFLDEENVANQFRMQKEIAGAQRKTGELQVFLQYAIAVSEDNTKLAEFLYNRFPAPLKNAFLAWKSTDPYNNPKAPQSPFAMKEYEIPEWKEAANYAEQVSFYKSKINAANSHADNYVLLSLVLSMVLFFSGLSGVTDSYLNQRILLGIASLTFAVALVFIITLPAVI